MFRYVAGILFLAIQLWIVWVVYRMRDEVLEAFSFIGKQMAITNKNLGEIKMNQKDFDAKVDGLIETVNGLDAKTDGESAQVATLVQGYKDEIQRLKDEHPNLDVSRLDELNSKLDEAGIRIGAIVPDEQQTQTKPPQSGDKTPAQTVDEQPAAEDSSAASEDKSVEVTETTKVESSSNETSATSEEPSV